MTDLTPDHPAVEAAHDSSMAWLEDMHGDLPDDEMVCVLTAALPHLESATEENLARLRNTPVGRALMAESWDMGWAGGAYGKDRHDNPHREYN